MNATYVVYCQPGRADKLMTACHSNIRSRRSLHIAAGKLNILARALQEWSYAQLSLLNLVPGLPKLLKEGVCLGGAICIARNDPPITSHMGERWHTLSGSAGGLDDTLGEAPIDLIVEYNSSAGQMKVGSPQTVPAHLHLLCTPPAFSPPRPQPRTPSPPLTHRPRVPTHTCMHVASGQSCEHTNLKDQLHVDTSILL